MVCSQSSMFNEEKSGRPAGGSEAEGSSTQPWLKGPLAGHFTVEMPVFLCLEEGCCFTGVFMS